MAVPSGIGGQIGFAAESTYGTGVTVTRFLEFNNEGLKADVRQIQSFGIGRGRFMRTTRNKSYVAGATGAIELPIMSKGFGLLLKHALGAHTAVQQGATSEYLHTATASGDGLVGLSLTTQIGRPDVGGTVRPYTYEGCKVTSWEIKNDLDAQALMSVTLDAETETTGTALATASYAASDQPFYFSQAAVTLGGNPIRTRSISIKGENALATDRRFLGGTKAEPLPNGEATIMASLDFEFEGLTRHGYWTAGTELENLVITWDTGTAIPSGDGGTFKLRVTIPKLIVMSAGPNVSGPDLVREAIEAKAVYDGSNAPVKVEMWTTDSAA